jgi:hypothetical protein
VTASPQSWAMARPLSVFGAGRRSGCRHGGADRVAELPSRTRLPMKISRSPRRRGDSLVDHQGWSPPTPRSPSDLGTGVGQIVTGRHHSSAPGRVADRSVFAFPDLKSEPNTPTCPIQVDTAMRSKAGLLGRRGARSPACPHSGRTPLVATSSDTVEAVANQRAPECS